MQTNYAESLKTKVERFYVRIKLEKQNLTMVSESKPVRVMLYLQQTINLVVAPNFIVLNNKGQRRNS